ncbi:hypothetical protein CLOM621_04906 [Clostridium sp. M62/1]|nr:hypothetical protein CLOM621_04906 [Clostridium sp. M62/1]
MEFPPLYFILCGIGTASAQMCRPKSYYNRRQGKWQWEGKILMLFFFHFYLKSKH